MTTSVRPCRERLPPYPLDLGYAASPFPPHVRHASSPTSESSSRSPPSSASSSPAWSIPLVGAVGYGASATARSMQEPPRGAARRRRWPQRTRVLDRNGNTIATFYDENRVNVPLNKVAPIMQQRDHRDRGLPLLPARRPRPEGHAARVREQPDLRRRHPGWVLDHPADGQDDAAHPGQAPRRSARRPPRTPTSARSRSSGTRSRSSRTTPRTGSSSATSTSPTSVTAPTASRRPPATTSRSTPASSTRVQAATLAGLVKNPVGFDPTTLPGPGASRAATSCSTGWPSSTSSPRTAAQQLDQAPLGLKVTQAPQRLPRHRRRLLLRLRPPLPARRPVPRQAPSTTAASCSTAAA